MSTHTPTQERGKISRFVFLGLACLLVVSVLVQIFMAGMALFTDSAYWRSHVIFVRIFEYLPILMLIFSFAGKLPKSLRWLSLLLFVLIWAQYFTAHVPGAGAFHTVIAAVLFWTAVHVMIRANRVVR